MRNVTSTTVAHPAKFTPAIIEVMVEEVYREIHRRKVAVARFRTLDPMAGVGRVHQLPGSTVGVELEPEWAVQHADTIVADARDLPFDADTFDCIATSPCLEMNQRILTDDLRWVPVGDVEVGDRIVAFDEWAPGVSAVGGNLRRKWRFAEVVRSEPMKVPCVRVILENGDEVFTTPNHPWLASRYLRGGRQAAWVPSRELAGTFCPGGTSAGRQWRAGMRQPWFVLKQLSTWTQRTSFEAGWLSGMFDGEGSLSLGVQGSPKLMMCQAEGPLVDRAERLMAAFGYEPNRIARTNTPEGHQKMANLYVTGGFPGLLRALGELRPERLVAKWLSLPITSRALQAEKVRVVAVEDAGCRDIQGIETTSGTYIGEGYLHHNTYGNRFSDHHDARDASKRRSYTHTLGRQLTTGNTGNMVFRNSQTRYAPYRVTHEHIWRDVVRVLKPTGIFLLNVSDFIAGREQQHVSAWHAHALLDLGLVLEQRHDVKTPRMRHGQNHQARVEVEHIFRFRKPARKRGKA